MVVIATILVTLLLSAGAWGQTQLSAEEAELSANIRIDLPEGVDPFVSVLPSADRVVLDLPLGALLPDSFSEASAGLLRDSTVNIDGDRVRVVLELAHGYLGRFDYEPGAVVLHFQSRFRETMDVGGSEDEYRLGPGDKLLVTVHNQEELTGTLEVSREGFVTAPLVGNVKAAGLTPTQLSARIAERFDRTYLVDPRVDIAVQEYLSQWVIVGGEVLTPGRAPLRGGTRLKEVIGEANGFTEYSGEEISISRKLENGETATLHVDRREYESGKMNPMLAHGDLIEVARAPSCFIQGEVREAGKVRIERGMTLLRAIALAGGLTDWANRKNVTILFEDGRRPSESYNLNKIEKGAVRDPSMEGGELIIVKRRFL